VIVNPIAGMGGRVGLKGTDGEKILGRARALGAAPVSPARAMQALAKLAPVAADIGIFTYPGKMGAAEASACGLDAKVIGATHGGGTTAADTRAAAREMLGLGVELLLFAGGDGTARDIFDTVGARVPILGIPTGVKMHSAVFATSPEDAGLLAADFLGREGGEPALRDAEVMDIDEEAFRENRLSARLHGYAKVPRHAARMQAAKSGAPPGEDAALAALAHHVAEGMEDGWLYIVGPGTTTARIMERLGLGGTLLGVDAVRDGELVGADLGEAGLLELVGGGARTRIIVTIIGGQGYVFGRGNQQISAPVIDAVGAGGIMVVATMAKIVALDGRPLRVDTGAAETDRMLAGYMAVVTGPGQRAMLRISS
jgi:predicted polyphosphate/ATP-dependent NAD kinase